MEEENKEQEIQNSTETQPEAAETPAEAVEPEKTEEVKTPVEKKKVEEFSLQWHLRVLAIIYGVLFVLYIILKLTLK